MARMDDCTPGRRSLAGAFALALFIPSVFAQSRPPKIYRLGLLRLPDNESNGFDPALRGELARLGYREGENLSIDTRIIDREPDKLAKTAADLVNSKPDVIITAGGAAAALAVQAASKTVPIVFTLAGDPVRRGLVASLGRPGSNATGSALLFGDLEFKRIQLISDTVGKDSRVAILLGPTMPNAKTQFGDRLKVAMPDRAHLLTIYSAAGPDDLEAAFETIAREQNAAVSIVATPIFGQLASRIADLASKFRLPGIGFDRDFADHGLLLSYAPDRNELLVRAAAYTQRIFNGATPADLPVELVSRFQLTVNNRTARQLSIKIPEGIRASADDFIE
jgi:putative tryptophan/tyrosine transport system substrate-binding protein